MAVSKIHLYRRTRILVYGDSITAGKGAGGVPTFNPSWTLPAQQFLENYFGADRPTFMNSGNAGDTIAQAHTNFAARVKPHNPHVLILAFLTNDFSTATGTVTSGYTTLAADALTAGNYEFQRVPRAVYCHGAMCSNGVFGEDWSQESGASAFAVRNPLIQAVAATNSFGFGDPRAAWLSIEGIGSTANATPVDFFTTQVIGGVFASTLKIGSLVARNPAHASIPANNTGWCGDGTHVTGAASNPNGTGGAHIWSYVFLQQCVLHRDEMEPGV